MYALMLLVIVAIMGLALDVGYAYVSYARLRRAVDAAALNASNQIKEGYSLDDLKTSAIIFLQLNNVYDPSIEVRVCERDNDYNPIDPSNPMCEQPGENARKLVSITASSQVPTFFMSVLGFNSFPISAEAESEAATIDVILVIDVSESMTYDYPAGHPLRDPWLCSELGACMPFETLKSASKAFVEELYFPYDRVAIITFDRYATEVLELTNEKQDVLNAIDNLRVYSGVPCPIYDEESYDINNVTLAENNSMCRLYKENEGADATFLPGGARWSTPAVSANASNWPFANTFCPQTELYLAGDSNMNDLRGHCNSTNMGAGLAWAGNALARGSVYETGHPKAGLPVPKKQQTRDESLWVVIVLADGAANVAYSNNTLLCPVPGECRLNKPDTRYSADTNPLQYDPHDYSLDMADYLYGMEVYTFGIGIGPYIVGHPAGEALMNYVVAPVDHADYQSPARGIYYTAPDASELREIFLKIANNIATRITR